MNESESSADDPRRAENLLDPRGRGIRCDIEVLGSAAEQKISDRTADNIGLVAVLPEPLDYADGVRIDTGTVDAVFVGRVHNCLGDWFSVFCSSISDEQCESSHTMLIQSIDSIIPRKLGEGSRSDSAVLSAFDP